MSDTPIRYDSSETIPMQAAEIRQMLADDAEHHVPEDHPTRPDLGQNGEVCCPACHGGLNYPTCPTCRGTAKVSPAVFEAFHASERE
jgi:hypothetical protein